jgi:CBS domain-containing protein
MGHEPSVKEPAMRIGDLCTREVVTCSRSASATEVARLMREQHVGDVIVVERRDAGDVPVGIVTDRDIVVEVVARGVDPELFTAGDMMTAGPVTAFESEDVHDAIWHLRGKAIRRLPVVDDQNRLRGILTVDAVAVYLAAELADLARIATQQREVEAARRVAATA